MAMQTKKSWQDYMTASFGEHGYSKPLAQMIEVGAVAQDGTIFQRLPIGTSSGGTAVMVDLIAAEAVSVSVGSVGINGFTGTAGTAALIKLTASDAGALNISGTITGAGTVVGVGALGNVAAGTITKVEGGTISALAAGTITAGTINAGNLVKAYHGTVTIASSDTNMAGTEKVVMNGELKGLTWITPDMEDSDSTKLEILDEKGYEVYDSGTKAESGTYTTMGTALTTSYQLPFYGTTSFVFTAEGTQSANRTVTYYIKYV